MFFMKYHLLKMYNDLNCYCDFFFRRYHNIKNFNYKEKVYGGKFNALIF